mmetsp:Transcript_51559/g.130355  ORF Transcript_51559/g.130355 Transcript_51559/m.130355 type:complete len:304 (+) Transcript_51559:359-1270(+)
MLPRLLLRLGLLQALLLHLPSLGFDLSLLLGCAGLLHVPAPLLLLHGQDTSLPLRPFLLLLTSAFLFLPAGGLPGSADGDVPLLLGSDLLLLLSSCPLLLALVGLREPRRELDVDVDLELLLALPSAKLRLALALLDVPQAAPALLLELALFCLARLGLEALAGGLPASCLQALHFPLLLPSLALSSESPLFVALQLQLGLVPGRHQACGVNGLAEDAQLWVQRACAQHPRRGQHRVAGTQVLHRRLRGRRTEQPAESCQHILRRSPRHHRGHRCRNCTTTWQFAVAPRRQRHLALGRGEPRR